MPVCFASSRVILSVLVLYAASDHAVSYHLTRSSNSESQNVENTMLIENITDRNNGTAETAFVLQF